MAGLRDYMLDSDWHPVSNGDWVFATKDGTNYFIKKFRYPKYPLDTSSRIFEQRKNECNEWVNNQNRLLSELKRIAGPSGNVVVPLELFREGATFYKVTLKINMSTMSPPDISALPDNEILLLLKTMIASVSALHQARIVHGDLKPENILVSRSEHGRLISKVIDFDDSYFELAPPKNPEHVIGTPDYYSPELANYVIDKNLSFRDKITCKSDIFALGIIFHEYITGHKPSNPKMPKAGAYYIVGNGDELTLDPGLSPDMAALLKRMLLLNADDRPGCTEVLAILKSIKESRGAGPKPELPPPPPPPAKEDDGRIKRILPLSPVMFKIEYESGKFQTVPIIYIRANHLEGYIETGEPKPRPEPLDPDPPPPPDVSSEGVEDNIKRIVSLSRSMFKIEYESGRFITVPLMYIRANKLEDRVEKT